MPHHEWGDAWFERHGDNLNKAIRFCLDNWKRYGRLGSHGKEKFGTFRHHMYFYYGYWGLHELVNPGYVSYWWPKWFMPIDRFIGKVFKYTGIRLVINTWQRFIYNTVIQLACKRWPDIIDEIVSDSDFQEFIKPGLFGKVDGQKIHDKYWIKVGSLRHRELIENRRFREYLDNLDNEDYLELLKEAWAQVSAGRIVDGLDKWREHRGLMLELERGDRLDD